MPQMNQTFKCKSKGGKETTFDVGIEFYWGGFSRQPLSTGHLGQKGHDIRQIRVERLTPLNNDGKVVLDDQLMKLAAATGQDAYFGGELCQAYPGDPGNVVLKLGWDSGHIVDYNVQPTADGIKECFDICVTELRSNNCVVRCSNAPGNAKAA